MTTWIALPADAIAGLVIIAPEAGTDDVFLENAFLLLKKAAPALRRSAEELAEPLFCTVSRLDGAFGCGSGTHWPTRSPAVWPDW